MKKKYSLILDDDFVKYCELNDIQNIEEEAKKTFKRGFDILKYGEVPSIIQAQTNKKINNQQQVVKKVVDKKDNLYSE